MVYTGWEGGAFLMVQVIKESVCNAGDAGDRGSGWEGGKLQFILAICPSR